MRSALPSGSAQSQTRIAPERAGKRRTKIAPGKTDIPQHPVVEACEYFEVAPGSQPVRTARQQPPDNGGQWPQRAEEGVTARQWRSHGTLPSNPGHHAEIVLISKTNVLNLSDHFP
jgi:hypothetical protein